MKEVPMTNLDIRCAELGRKIASIKDMQEKTLKDALSVLEEQGPYAMFLYLQAHHSKVANAMEPHALGFLQEIFEDKIPGENSVLVALKKLAEDLDDLLFARDLLRNTLSYALYHVKAPESRRR